MHVVVLVFLGISLWIPGAIGETDSDLFHQRTDLSVMGTELIVEAYGLSSSHVATAVSAAIAELRRVENVMTSWRDSPLMALNARSGQGPQAVALELAQIVSRGLELGRLTDGAFDITFAGVGNLWDFRRSPPVIPSKKEIDAALPLVGYERVTVNPVDVTVDLPAGMKVGLGGMAKGYGVDRAMDILMEHGIQHGVVDAGGDMKVLGLQNGKPWEIAIKHPRVSDWAIAVLKISNQTVVTSGDYERFFEVNGKRYHHILDPRTGYPATGCMSATVVSPSAEYGDALATAICVMGSQKAGKLVAQLPHVEALWVDRKGDVHVSDGLRGALTSRQGEKPDFSPQVELTSQKSVIGGRHVSYAD